ncbi:MAG: peptide-methionine (S)-S-oxide reductase MsrA [Saprospiraceae bacterium]|nr:peptide-methionine (S)-S-oxide reductase MsrA [Saprospiraceae bacterium]
MKKAYFGGGCFWCVEAVFQRIKGVNKVISGYAGGKIKNPTYREICTGTTGHAEIVKIEYDQSIISYDDLLLVFFNTHDPTTLNQQGNDKGTQYRSIIFYTEELERKLAESFINNEAVRIWDGNITTALEKLETFYPAENYHQDYYNNHQSQGYCTFIIKPKVDKLNERFKSLLK